MGMNVNRTRVKQKSTCYLAAKPGHDSIRFDSIRFAMRGARFGLVEEDGSLMARRIHAGNIGK